MQFKERTVNNANAIRIPQAIPCPEAADLDPRLPSLCESDSTAMDGL